MTCLVVMVAAMLAQAPGPAGLSERGPRGDGLDYGERPPIEGFVRWKGGCGDAFPFNLQYPVGWKVRGDRRAFQRERTGDSTFLIRISELAVSSTFGPDLTMQILRSLEPVRCE